MALLEREVLDGGEVKQLIDGEKLTAIARTPPSTPAGGEQQVIKPEPPRRLPGMLPEGGPQPA
jgi:hypothetical protein